MFQIFVQCLVRKGVEVDLWFQYGLSQIACVKHNKVKAANYFCRNVCWLAPLVFFPLYHSYTKIDRLLASGTDIVIHSIFRFPPFGPRWASGRRSCGRPRSFDSSGRSNVTRCGRRRVERGHIVQFAADTETSMYQDKDDELKV